VPAFGTLYQRLTLPESTRFLSAQKLKHHDHANEAGDDIDELKKAQKSEDTNIPNKAIDSASDDTGDVDEATAPLEVLLKKKAHFRGMPCYLFPLESCILILEL
jgi:PHS family inorganic phosphate transporter-like MFS transporter